MKRQHEQLLVATLAGIIILGGAVFAVAPSMAAAPDAPHAAPCELAPAEITFAAAAATAVQPQGDDAAPAADLWCRIADPEAPIGQGPKIAFGAA
jgi:hypothetical protein